MSEQIIDKIRKCDTNKPYIFISYSSKDRELVWQDVLEFQRRGYNVWMDEINLDKTNDGWDKDVVKAIRDFNSILLIFYVSRYSLTSEACYAELKETVSDETKRRHKRKELKFIAVEAEPIGDIQQFADEVDDMIRTDTSETKKVRDSKIDTLYLFLEEFFNNNNARVRVKYKNDPSRAGKLDYYEDILLEYCDKAKIYSAQEEPVPAPAPTPAPTPVHISAPAPVSEPTVTPAPAAEDPHEEKPTPASAPVPAPAVTPAPMVKKPHKEKPAPVYAKPSGTVDAAMGQISLADIRERFSDAETVRAFRAVREGMPWGGKGAMDYLMAALLGGCNQVTKTSPGCQITYYLYAVAAGEQKGDSLGATWTWSSNCRKVLGLEKSGQIPQEINQHFADLDGAVTLRDVAICFQKAEEPPFRTLKNDLILHAASELDAFLKR